MALETLLNQESLNKINRGLIQRMEELITPVQLKERFPLSGKAEKTVIETRRDIVRILNQKDNRLMIICGPCSVDDPKAAIEYAERVKVLSDEVKDKIILIMRTYFEKPRTTIGWKGLIYDPRQDGSSDISEGLKISREFLIKVNELGVGCATEFLSPIIHPYISDNISYGSIGARTTESQIEREFPSGLAIPIGFKNTTEGNVQTAIDAIITAQHPHVYPGVSENGYVAIIQTQGNKYAHLILRGGNKGPNYDEVSVQRAITGLRANNLLSSVVIDCSHANSNKEYSRQPEVAKEVVRQRLKNENIRGIMLESYLVDGKGKMYGQSKTDACIGWEITKKTIKEIYDLLPNP